MTLEMVFLSAFLDKNGDATNENTPQSEEDFETNQDLDLELEFATLDDGRVICLRCTLLCCNITQAEIHYKEQHMGLGKNMTFQILRKK